MASHPSELAEKWTKKGDGLTVKIRSDPWRDLARMLGITVPHICYDTSGLFGARYELHIDHPFTVFYKRKPVAVGWEPYDRSMRDYSILLAFCRDHDLKFTVSGHSPHYPNNTHSILIYGDAYEEISKVWRPK